MLYGSQLKRNKPAKGAGTRATLVKKKLADQGDA